MGRSTFSRSLYKSAVAAEGVGERGVTAKSEQKAYETGKLDPLVDPSGFGVIRLSLPRVERKCEHLYELNVGTPMPIETRVDTTGSMGHNVDVAMKVLPDAFEQWTKVLKGYDIQVATGIFGDVRDKFPLCRPQFEMHTEKIVKQLTLMVPEKNGGDVPEDPDLGIFGGAYLVRAYINRIGLKGYDFTVTDAPGRGRIDQKELERVYGDKVFEKVAENQHRLNSHGSIELSDVWNVLLDRAHAFVLQVGDLSGAKTFWHHHVGKNRVVQLPDTEFLPHVQAVIIGLTEGSLTLTDVADFLKEGNMEERWIDRVCESVANIPLSAQAQLPNFSRRPVKGDLFDGKPDVWEDTNIWPNLDPEFKAAVHGVAPDSIGEPAEKDDWL